MCMWRSEKKLNQQKKGGEKAPVGSSGMKLLRQQLPLFNIMLLSTAKQKQPQDESSSAVSERASECMRTEIYIIRFCYLIILKGFPNFLFVVLMLFGAKNFRVPPSLLPVFRINSTLDPRSDYFLSRIK